MIRPTKHIIEGKYNTEKGSVNTHQFFFINLIHFHWSGISYIKDKMAEGRLLVALELDHVTEYLKVTVKF